ncbi:MAG TPA: hypothetical protein DCR90_03600 [Fusobacteriaceae bacterium]|nr:hypothetical protein [Fusobacteriaceae bacterium]
MYRYILILALSLSTISCTGLSKVKDRYHRAPFEKEIKKGDYELTFYNIDYPIEYEEKIKFYKDFDIFVKKVLINDSIINIMSSERFKEDITELENSYTLPEERIFLKSASELSQAEREKIDKIMEIKIDEKIGKTQYYLNKQVYFWKKIIEDNKIFNSKINYTELDKEKLILQIKEKRKKIFEIVEQGKLNLILKIEQPYVNKENVYWEKKDVYIDRNTKLLPRILKKYRNLYLSEVEDIDVKKIMGEQLKFNSEILIIENKLYNGYIVSDNKYIFFYGGEKNINYYDGYNLKIKVQDISLKDLLTIDKQNLITNFLNTEFYKERQEK